jgi:hypothetical protein
MDSDIANSHLAEKIRTNDIYAQNMYAALCNNDFVRNEPFEILKEQVYSVSWRTAGRIIAEIRGGTEYYLDWYCSGMANNQDFVSEGTVTTEIKQDLLTINWIVLS